MTVDAGAREELSHPCPQLGRYYHLGHSNDAPGPPNDAIPILTVRHDQDQISLH